MPLLYASDLSDAEWTLLEPLLPPESPIGRLHSLRTILNAIFYQLRTGGAWRFLPQEWPPWSRPRASAGSAALTVARSKDSSRLQSIPAGAHLSVSQLSAGRIHRIAPVEFSVTLALKTWRSV
jgi:transposase